MYNIKLEKESGIIIIMNFVISVSILLISNHVIAQTELVFKSGMEFVSKLNDTGITWGGGYTSGNNPLCTSNIASSQDCHQGRDATHNVDGDGYAGFSFTKLDVSGNPLANQSVDYATMIWTCVQDNVTGLVWEVKTTTTGIHNRDNTYQWGGLTAIGRDNSNRKGTYYEPSWNELINGSNSATLCGYDNWRVPTASELSSIVIKGTINQVVDPNFFPNTASDFYWSASPVASNDITAWIVYFSGDGGNANGNRSSNGRVRLVRSR